MSKVRIIPRLDIKGANVVKGVHFEGIRKVGLPKELATKYFKDGADEILYIDVVASLYQRSFDFTQLAKTTSAIFIPVTVGGGIRSIDDVGRALRSGADKVAINTHAILSPRILSRSVDKFGAQCIVLSVEAKRTSANSWEAYTNGGRERSGKDVVAWVKEAIRQGVGEILVSSVDMDGTRRGCDVDLVRAISSFSPVPVIAHGGVGTLDSIFDVVKVGMADAVGAASIFHYNYFPIKKVKSFLKARGVDVRIV